MMKNTNIVRFSLIVLRNRCDDAELVVIVAVDDVDDRRGVVKSSFIFFFLVLERFSMFLVKLLMTYR